MCRSEQQGGRRCPHGSDGTRGCEYFDERIKKVLHIPDPPQSFPTIHKQNMEELREKYSKETLEQPVTPEQFESFHRVVNKMIKDSNLSEHDKMIARKQWNRTQKEVGKEEVTQVTLASWQKMMMGSGLFLADQMGSGKTRPMWRGYSRFLKTSFSIREFGELGDTRILPHNYDTEEEFQEAVAEAGQEDTNDYGWFDNPEEFENNGDDDNNEDNENKKPNYFTDEKADIDDEYEREYNEAYGYEDAYNSEYDDAFEVEPETVNIETSSPETKPLKVDVVDNRTEAQKTADFELAVADALHWQEIKKVTGKTDAQMKETFSPNSPKT